MTVTIGRRELLVALGGAAAAWPLAARAQQSVMPVIGFLDFGSAAERTQQVAAFRKGLAQAGYQEGQNLAFEFRWAEGQYERFPELAADLVRRGVNVIAVPGSGTGALAAKAATTTIPIVFGVTGDPVKPPPILKSSRSPRFSSRTRFRSPFRAKRTGNCARLRRMGWPQGRPAWHVATG
jgi:hypothetical protein